MRGHLVIADISGYTQFLTESELEHAHGIITDLLNAVISVIHAPLTVSSVEGDAVFLYGSIPEGTYGQTVLESVENLYCSFASALETMVVNTTCDCNACANINTLGLKIVMHCGEFIKSQVGDRETLTGPDVIAVHRLLKNHVREETGISDYLMVTQACVDELGLERMVAGWTEHSEQYDHIGVVRGYVSSLPDVWAFVKQQTENKVLKDQAWVTGTGQSTAPPAIVWDYLIDPRKRTKWMEVLGNTVTGETAGRVAPGTEYHCAHGDNEISVFTVIDMRPPEYITMMTEFVPGSVVRYTHYLLASGAGTRVITCAAPPASIETGETLPELAGPDQTESFRDNLQATTNRMLALTDAAVTEELTQS